MVNTERLYSEKEIITSQVTNKKGGAIYERKCIICIVYVCRISRHLFREGDSCFIRREEV